MNEWNDSSFEGENETVRPQNTENGETSAPENFGSTENSPNENAQAGYQTAQNNPNYSQRYNPNYGAGPNYSPNYYRDWNPNFRQNNGWNDPNTQNFYRGNPGNGGWQPGQNMGSQNNAGMNGAYVPNQNQQKEYKWNFEDYDRLNTENREKVKQKKEKRKGLAVFAALMGALLVIGLSVFVGFKLGSGKTVIGPVDSENSSQQTGPINSDLPNLILDDTPSNGSTTSVPENGVLTISQIATKATPSIVGVVQYQGLQGYRSSGEGSGIVMTKDGYIITNAHVIEGASSIKVVLQNGDSYDAQIIGYDTRTDLAVIKIEATGLTPAEFGNSDQLQIGEMVVAIGNPGGLAFAGSVTDGIVSALNREVTTENGTMNCIQTNAAINPGNSGGALLNQYGQVIGINSSKISATGYEGMGFAIPISTAQPIINDLIQNGRVTGRVLLGISGYDIDEYIARYNNVPVGVFLYTINQDSSLAQSGVKAGDILTGIDGTALTGGMQQLRSLLEKYHPGDRVTFTVYRTGSQNSMQREFEVTITLQEDMGTQNS